MSRTFEQLNCRSQAFVRRTRLPDRECNRDITLTVGQNTARLKRFLDVKEICGIFRQPWGLGDLRLRPLSKVTVTVARREARVCLGATIPDRRKVHTEVADAKPESKYPRCVLFSRWFRRSAG